MDILDMTFSSGLSSCVKHGRFLVIYGATTPRQAILAVHSARLARDATFGSVISLFSRALLFQLVATAQQRDAKEVDPIGHR
jgi:hypothetical protein